MNNKRWKNWKRKQEDRKRWWQAKKYCHLFTLHFSTFSFRNQATCAKVWMISYPSLKSWKSFLSEKVFSLKCLKTITVIVSSSGHRRRGPVATEDDIRRTADVAPAGSITDSTITTLGRRQYRSGWWKPTFRHERNNHHYLRRITRILILFLFLNVYCISYVLFNFWLQLVLPVQQRRQWTRANLLRRI